MKKGEKGAHDFGKNTSGQLGKHYTGPCLYYIV